jgi:hypothetical protein
MPSSTLPTGALATVGVSPKTKLAAALPFIGSLLFVVVHWAITGEWNKVETEGAVVGLVSALLAFAGAWLGAPGAVVEQPATPSDAGLDPEVIKKLHGDE